MCFPFSACANFCCWKKLATMAKKKMKAFQENCKIRESYVTASFISSLAGGKPSKEVFRTINFILLNLHVFSSLTIHSRGLI